jgi:hypothetical protein
MRSHRNILLCTHYFLHFFTLRIQNNVKVYTCTIQLKNNFLVSEEGNINMRMLINRCGLER